MLDPVYHVYICQVSPAKYEREYSIDDQYFDYMEKWENWLTERRSLL